jgi:hypothetical protein
MDEQGIPVTCSIVLLFFEAGTVTSAAGVRAGAVDDKVVLMQVFLSCAKRAARL